jgi:hypothetical protein
MTPPREARRSRRGHLATFKSGDCVLRSARQRNGGAPVSTGRERPRAACRGPRVTSLNPLGNGIYMPTITLSLPNK